MIKDEKKHTYEDKIEEEAKDKLTPDSSKLEQLKKNTGGLGGATNLAFAGAVGKAPIRTNEAENRENDVKYGDTGKGIEIAQQRSPETWEQDIKRNRAERENQLTQNHLANYINTKGQELLATPEAKELLSKFSDPKQKRQALLSLISDNFKKDESYTKLQDEIAYYNLSEEERGEKAKKAGQESVSSQLPSLRRDIEQMLSVTREVEGQKQVDKVQDILDNEKNPLRRGLALSAHISTQPGTVHPETDALNTALKYVKDSENIMREHNDPNKDSFSGKMKSAWRGFKDKAFSLDNWTLGVTEALDQIIVNDIVRKVENGEQLSDTETKLMDALAINLATNLYYDEANRGYTWGSIPAESLPFMLEFMLNPVTGAGNAVSKAVAKYGVKKFGSKVAQKGMQYAGRLAGDLTTSALMTATTGSVRTITDVEKRMQGEHSFAFNDETGDIEYAGREGQGDGLITAMAKGIGSQFIEYQSEMFGERLGAIGEIAGATKLGSNISRKYSASAFGKITGRIGNSSIAKNIKALEKRAQWSGVIEEWIEEQQGTFMNALFVGDEKMSDLTNKDQQVDTFMGLLLSGGVMSGMQTTGYATDRIKTGHKLNKLDNIMPEYLSNWEELKGQISEMNVDDRKSAIIELSERNDMSLGARQNLVDYISTLSYNDAMKSSFEESVSDDSRKASEKATDMFYTYLSDKRASLLHQYSNQMNELGNLIPNLVGLDASEVDELLASEQIDSQDLENYRKYQNLKSLNDGIVENLRAEVDNAIQPQLKQYQDNINEDGETIIQINLGSKEQPDWRFVNKGNIVLNEDGSIDRMSSSNMLYSKNEDGKTEQIALSRVYEAIASPYADIEEEIKEEAYKQIIDPFAKKIDGETIRNINDQVEYVDTKGNPKKGQIVEIGEHTITMIDSEGKTEIVTKNQLNNSELTPTTEDGLRARDEITVYIDGVEHNAFVDDIKADGTTTIGVLDSTNPEHMFMTLSKEELNNMRQPQMPTDAISQAEQLKEKGANNNETATTIPEPIQATESKTGEIVTNSNIYESEDEKAVRERREFEESLPRYESGKNKGEIDQSKMSAEQNIRLFEYEFGQDVAVEASRKQVENLNKRIKAEQNKLEASPFDLNQRKKVAEMQKQLKSYSDYINSIEARQKESVPKPEQIIQEAESEIERLKESIPKNRDKREAWWGEPHTMREFILRKFISGQKIAWDDVDSSRGLAKELGFTGGRSEMERRKRISLIGSKNTNAATPEQLAHAIWEEIETTPFGVEYNDTEAIKNEILDIMLTYYSTGQMIDDINQSRIKDETDALRMNANDAAEERNKMDAHEVAYIEMRAKSDKEALENNEYGIPTETEINELNANTENALTFEEHEDNYSNFVKNNNDYEYDYQEANRPDRQNPEYGSETEDPSGGQQVDIIGGQHAETDNQKDGRISGNVEISSQQEVAGDEAGARESEDTARSVIRDERKVDGADSKQRGESAKGIGQKNTALIHAIQKLSNQFNIPIKVHSSSTTINNKTALRELEKGSNVKGWYDVKTGEAHIYLPNADSIEDVQSTFLHEALAHKGLRDVLGEEKHDQLLVAVFDALPKEIQDKLLQEYGGDKKIAADEFIAAVAEKGEFMNMPKKNLIQIIVDAIKKLFGDLKIETSAAEILANQALNDAMTRLQEQRDEDYVDPATKKYNPIEHAKNIVAKQNKSKINETLDKSDTVKDLEAQLRELLGENDTLFRKDDDNDKEIDKDFAMYQIGTKLAAEYFKNGVIEYQELADAMTSRIGQSILPYVQSFYEGIRHLPTIKQYAGKMTSQKEVQKINKMLLNNVKEVEEHLNQKQLNIFDEQTPNNQKNEETRRDTEESNRLGESQRKGPIQNEREGVDRGNAINNVDNETGSRGTVRASSKSENSGRIIKNIRNNKGERGVDYAPSSIAARYNANVNAIKVLKDLEQSNRDVPTEEEAKILRQYSGWGGLGTLFNNNNKENSIIRELLTPEEYEAAELSINSAYYTPAYITDTLWDIATKLGFKGGNILESSAGIGNIIGQMPSSISEKSNIEATELDTISGNILRLLYPDAKVNVTGFEDTDVRPGTIDLAITNVPFVTGLSVYDAKNKDLSKKFKNIHDFFIAKNIRALKEGGIGIFITSNGTLDKSKALRNWIGNEAKADVIGAFRMNNETFSGTKVTSDIIIVRKRVAGQKYSGAIDISQTSVERATKFDDRQTLVEYNAYYIDNPQFMAGEMKVGHEMGETFRPYSVGLYPSSRTNQQKQLSEWVDSIPEIAPDNKLDNPNIEKNQTEASQAREGELTLTSDGTLALSQRGEAVPLGINANKVKGQYEKSEVVKDYIAIKDALNEALEYQANNNDDSGLKPYLDKLNKAYDTFKKKYDRINNNRTISFLSNDIDFPTIAAIEKYEEVATVSGKKKITVEKTDVFKGRVVGIKTEAKPTNLTDGVIASTFLYGAVNLDYIAKELGLEIDQVKQNIIKDKLGYENPANGLIEVPHEYLSGNVREKLEIAKSLNENGQYNTNIAELEKVIPMDIPAHLIEFSLGSSWIGSKLLTDYAKEKFDVEIELSHVEGIWMATSVGPYYNEKNREAGISSEKLQTTRYGHELFLAALNNKSVPFSRTYKNSDGTTETIVDKEASQAASTKIDEMRSDFKDWSKAKMQADPALANEIETIYNNKFNSIAPLTISPEFIPNRFDGANPKIELYPHQGEAAIRSTMQPIMLAHEVGSGKTFTIITSAMEMKRLGTAQKPMIVVQNATVGQFVESAKFLYPNAKVLTISPRDRTSIGRREFYAKIKYNDWDMIIIPQSVFDMIPDSLERQAEFIREKIEEKMHSLDNMSELEITGHQIRSAEKEISDLQSELNDLLNGGEKKKDAKSRAKASENVAQRAKEQLDRRTDDVEDFDSMGIDALLIDEAHNYKKLGFSTTMQRGVKGIDTSRSKKAAGAYLKTRAVYDKAGWKNVVFATGTPISNTAAELWTFMRYLMPTDVLKANDMYYFDDFVRNFGSISQMLEFTTSGKFRENTRFSSYVNKPELIRLWASVAHTVLSKDVKQLTDKLPNIKGGKAQDIFLPQTDSLIDIMRAVKARLQEFEEMSGKEKKENSHIPLVMYGVAKRASIDTRLVDKNAPDEKNSKTNKAVQLIIDTLNDKEISKYNGTIAVFSEVQNRKDADGTIGFNLFQDMKQKLIEQGVDPSKIAVIESSMSMDAKMKIFDAVNSGDIRVVMGSTQTLGTGVNIQERLNTLIHMDLPDRPMDYTQRNGRILRQGNLHREMNKEINIIQFGVEDSLDVTSFQRLQTKSDFIDSIMDGKASLENNQEDRILEEPEEGLFENSIAVLSGSQYALLKNQAEREYRKVQYKKKQHENDQVYIANKIKRNKSIISINNSTLEDLNKEISDINKLFPTGKASNIKIEGQKIDEATNLDLVFRDLVNKPINEKVDRARRNASFSTGIHTSTIELDGVEVKIHTRFERRADWDNRAKSTRITMSRDLSYSIPSLDIVDVPVSGQFVRGAYNEIIDNVITGINAKNNIEGLTNANSRMQDEIDAIEPRLGKEFEHEEELSRLAEKVEEMTKLMQQELEEKEAKYANMGSNSNSNINDAISEEEDVLFRITPSERTDSELQSIKEQAIEDGTFMKAPNGKPTNLNERQWLQTRTDAFKEWFGDWENDPENSSKVVDENGEPLVISHSTNSEFTEFIYQQLNDAGWLGAGYYFFGDRSLDGQYGKNVMELFLNVREPYYAVNEEVDKLSEENDNETSQEFTDELKSEGYDGVYFNGNLNQEWVVYHPNQIKSATDNVGSFDASNDDIRFRINDVSDESEITHERNKYSGSDYEIKENELRFTTYEAIENSDTYTNSWGSIHLNINDAINDIEFLTNTDTDRDGIMFQVIARDTSIPIEELKEDYDFDTDTWDSVDDFVEDFIQDIAENANEDYQSDENYIDIYESQRDNTDTDQLIWDVQKQLENEFDVNIGKYSKLYVNEKGELTSEMYSDFDDEIENIPISIRIADHTHNPSNGPNDLNILIADTDHTASRFIGARTDLRFNSENSVNEIVDEIKDFLKYYYEDNKDVRFRTGAGLGINNSNTNFKHDEKTRYYTDSQGREIPFKAFNPDGNRGRTNLVERKGSKDSKANDFALVERQFTEYNHLDFTAGTKIESLDDVAWLFRNLEDEAVEHAFAIYIMPDNSYVVQHLSTGGVAGTVLDHKLIAGNAVSAKANRVAFVHNHPSGQLIASRADMDVLSKLQAGLEGTGIDVMDGVIINLRSGKYVRFNSQYSEAHEMMSEQRQEQGGVQVLSFSKQVLADNYNPDKVTSSVDVAKLLSSKRFGLSDKTELIILNPTNQVLGKFVLPQGVQQYPKIVQLLTQYGGTSAILYGNKINEKTVRDYGRKLQALGFNLLDAIEVKSENYKSLADEGLIREESGEYAANSQKTARVINSTIEENINDLLEEIGIRFRIVGNPVSVSNEQAVSIMRADSRISDKPYYKYAKKKLGENTAKMLVEYMPSAVELAETMGKPEMVTDYLTNLIPVKSSVLPIIEQAGGILSERFKETVLSENPDAKTKERKVLNPFEVADSAGYKLFEAHSEDDIQSFKTYYRRSDGSYYGADEQPSSDGEMICTIYNGGRGKSRYVFFIRNNNWENILPADKLTQDNLSAEWKDYLEKRGRKNEDGTYDLNNLRPQREDPYSTSMLSIQLTKHNGSVDIISRYNHNVPNPNNTFNGKKNADKDFIPGLWDAIQQHKGFNEANGSSLGEHIYERGERIYYAPHEVDGMKYGDGIIVDYDEMSLMEFRPDVYFDSTHKFDDGVLFINKDKYAQIGNMFYAKGKIDGESNIMFHKPLLEISQKKNVITATLLDKTSNQTGSIEIHTSNGSATKIHSDDMASFEFDDLNQLWGPTYLETVKEISFTNIKEISQDVTFAGIKVFMPNLEQVNGELFLSGTGIKSFKESFPKLRKVNSLDIDETDITSLGNLNRVANFLTIRHTPLVDLGELEYVGNLFIMNGTPAETLGKLKYVGGNVNLKDNVNLKSLGNLQVIGGSLSIRNSDETSLNKLKLLGGSLYTTSYEKPLSLGSLVAFGGEIPKKNYEPTDNLIFTEMSLNSGPLNYLLQSLPNLKQRGSVGFEIQKAIKEYGDALSDGIDANVEEFLPDDWGVKDDVRFRKADELFSNPAKINESVEDYNKIIADVLNNSSQKNNILKDARQSGMRLDKSIENYIANDATFVEVEGIAKELGIDMPANAVRYMFWQKANPNDGSVEWKAKDAVRYRELKDNVLFRNGEPIRPSAMNEYERRVMSKRNNGLKGFMFGMEEGWFDRMASLKILQDSILKGKEMKEGMNAYLLENQLSSKNTAEIENYQKKYLDPMIKIASKIFGKDLKSIDYYLMAKHGFERNARMAKEEAASKSQKKRDVFNEELSNEEITQSEYNELIEKQDKIDAKNAAILEKTKDYSGLTQLYHELTGENETEYGEDTRTYLTKYVSDIESEAGDENVKELWNSIKRATQYMIRKQYDSGMMSKDNFDSIMGMYEYYVPLRGFEDTVATDIYEYLLNKPSDFNKVLMTAKGRTSMADSPFASILNMAESGIMQANRNNMKKAFYRLVATNPSNYASIKDAWYVEGADGQWTERHPDIPLDATGEEVKQIIDDFETEMLELEGQGDARRGRNKLDIGVRIGKSQASEHAVNLWINGEEKVVYVNGNPRAAQAINGLTNSSIKEKNKIARTAEFWMRQMSANFTSRNPAFMVTNAMRDWQFAIVSASIKHGGRYSAKFAQNTLVVGKTVAQNIWGDGNKQNAQFQKYWDEFTQYGGETGYASIHSMDINRKYVNKKLREFTNTTDLLIPFRAYAEQMSNANRLVEANTRFAAYVTSRQFGKTIEDSVNDSKDITINFNRKGSGGFGAEIVHNLFLFANPALQSMRQMGLMAKKHPVKFTLAMSATMASGYMIPLVNEILLNMFGDDDDKDMYFNISDWTRRNHVVMYVPGSKNRFITLSLPHELRGFYGLGEMAYSAANGMMRGKNIPIEALKQFGNNLPIDPTGGKSTFAPDVIKPLYEAYVTNNNFMGTPIYKDTPWNKHAPEWTKAYKRTSPILVGASKWLNEMSGGDDVVKGALDINPAKIQHVAGGYVGGAWTTYSDIVDVVWTAITGEKEDLSLNNVPIANKIVRTSDERNKELRINNEYFYWLDWKDKFDNKYKGYQKWLYNNDKQKSDEMHKYKEKLTNTARDQTDMTIYETINIYSKIIKGTVDAGAIEEEMNLKKELVDKLWELDKNRKKMSRVNQ